MPYSGPASAYGVIGKTEEAYFKKINAEGGINGRKINFISLRRRLLRHRRQWSMARKLVEQRRGAARSFTPLGTPVELRDPQIHERQEGAAAVRRHRRHQVE